MASKVLLERSAIEDIVRSAHHAVGVASYQVGVWRAFERLLRAATERGRRLKLISRIILILATVLPFLFDRVLDLIPDNTAKFVAGLFFALVWLAVLILGLIFPQDVLATSLHGEVVKARLVASRLAGQLALHNFIQEISSVDDKATIEHFSSLLDASATKKLLEQLPQVEPLVRNQKNEHWRNSRIEFALDTIDDDLQRKLDNIAHSIANASAEVFGDSRFKVKIYIKTEHEVQIASEPYAVKMLTAIARYPQKNEDSKYRGKSWIDCRGKRADVWEAHDKAEVCVYKSVKSASEKKVYLAIACIPMPDGLGVVSIEAADGSIFDIDDPSLESDVAPAESDVREPLIRHKISEDVHTSFAVAVKELVVRAMKSTLIKGAAS